MKEKETQAPKARCILEECCTASSLKGQHLRGDLSARAPGLGLCACIRQVFVYDYCSINATTSDTWHVVITLPPRRGAFGNFVTVFLPPEVATLQGARGLRAPCMFFLRPDRS